MTAVAATPEATRPRRRVRILRRFASRPTAMIGLSGVVAVTVIAVFAPLIAPSNPNASDYSQILRAPGVSGHLLGTDDLGRDLLSRLIFGSQISLTSGVLATLLALAAAVPVGMAAGYYRRWVDPIVSRATDVLLAFPFLIVAVGMAAILGPSMLNATVALAVGQAPGFIRIARAEVLAAAEQEYVQAAIVNSAPDRVIMARHILPNIASPIVVQATVAIPGAIIGAAVLSFLGLGVQPPTADWGTMLSQAQDYLGQAPWFAVLPGLAIAVTTLSFNLFGDGLRDALDVRMRS